MGINKARLTPLEPAQSQGRRRHHGARRMLPGRMQPALIFSSEGKGWASKFVAIHEPYLPSVVTFFVDRIILVDLQNSS